MAAIDMTAPVGSPTPAARQEAGPAPDVPAAAAPIDEQAAALEKVIDEAAKHEKFIPVTRAALIERMTRPATWRGSQAREARRFFRYLDYWRQASYSAKLIELGQTYEPFNPDTDLLMTRKFGAAERTDMQHRLVAQVASLLEQANYTRVDPHDVELILTKESHYGLDLHVDMTAFDELLIYFRGASHRTYSRRNLRQLYLYKEEYDVPIFQRLCILFKLKPAEVRITEIMAKEKCDRKEAEKILKKLRGALPSEINSDSIYLKMFKNIPRTDLEMCFPNTKVRFRLFDKIKLGVTAGSGLGMGVVGTASKIALASNPIALAGAVAGLGGVALRQATKFLHQRNQYMVTMAQNLYFHALADNRGVMTLLADRAAEEDVKEEILLYSVIAKEPVHTSELSDVDAAIEQYMLNAFGVRVNFDLEDALRRLVADGIVRVQPDGWLTTLPPGEAARHIDTLWDRYLDELPDPTVGEGIEFEYEADPETGA